LKVFLWAFTTAICLFIGSSYGADFPNKPIFYESELLKVLAPNAQRDERFSELLSPSVKIQVDGASGSGTICHYDEQSGFAHVISCGHLWSGNMKYNAKSELRPKAKIFTWYKNSLKLQAPETFEAEVLFWSNDRGYDVSLIRFKPDWSPGFAPIDGSFHLKKGLSLNSIGCDGGSEVARYEVIFESNIDLDITTSKNSPRPGRSGGGLITNHGKLVGVCWGTSDISSGNGTGYFTPVPSIRKVFEKNGHGWLLKIHQFKSIPVVDRDNPSKSYNEDFVPFPMAL
jgi:hypothetical protein